MTKNGITTPVVSVTRSNSAVMAAASLPLAAPACQPTKPSMATMPVVASRPTIASPPPMWPYATSRSRSMCMSPRTAGTKSTRRHAMIRCAAYHASMFAAMTAS